MTARTPDERLPPTVELPTEPELTEGVARALLTLLQRVAAARQPRDDQPASIEFTEA